ncbi:MAG: chemotaxis protein CheA [Planctomycetota bacterium]
MTGYGGMAEILQEFLIEAHELIVGLEQDLVALEQAPDPELLRRVFRGVHNLKGTAGVLGFLRLEELMHAAEDLLGRMRDGELQPTPTHAAALLGAIDAAKGLLREIEVTGQEGEAAAVAGCVRALRALLAGEPAPALVVVAPEPAREEPAPGEHPPGEPGSGDLGPGEPGPEGRARSVAERTVRTDVDVLDRLMNQVGELVLARNLIAQLTADRADPQLLAASHRLALVTTELQQSVTRTRMQAVDTLWSRFPRTVRDLSRAQGKRVRLVQSGEDTELDRSVLEAIGDPLLHLVRNAVDHGLEPVAERRARGKPEEGLLSLRAYHEGGYVYLLVQDDGRGIDPARLRDRARERGLRTSEELERAGDDELLQLIFEPGFSTAAEVTSVSGRGVGMDVVRANVERIGGSVEVESSPGAGTLVKLRIPLTLAIIPALLVESGGERLAIPQVNLQELVGLGGDGSGLERIAGTLVHRLREQLLPVVDLAAALELPARPLGPESTIVVVLAEGRPVGLLVDGVGDSEEIVVKPLGQHLRALQAFSGATILGDGDVALILDVVGVARSAGLLRRAALPSEAERAPAPAAEEEEGERAELLVFEGPGGRYAIPLAAAARLEELPRSRVERAGAQLVAQHRGEILRLVPLGDLWRAQPTLEEELPERLEVVVCHVERARVGLVVDRIVDVVDARLTVSGEGVQPGVARVAVVQDRVTQVLDLERLPSLRRPAAALALPGPAGGAP